MDPLQQRLTLGIAEESRAVHADHGGRCQDCRTTWPCEAYIRAHNTITRLTRPVGRAQVNPRWLAGQDSPAVRSGLPDSTSSIGQDQ